MEKKEWPAGVVAWANVVVRELQRASSAASRTGRLAFALATVACLSLAAPSMATDPIDWDLAVNTTPVRPTTEDRVHVFLTGNDTPDCVGLEFFRTPPQVDGFRVRLQGHRAGPVFECVPIRWDYDIVLPQLTTPGDYRIEVMDEDLLILSQRLEVFGPLKALVFPGEELLTAKLRLTDPRVGPARDASAVQLTSDSGYFWLFNPENIEVTVKLLDGHLVNGHYWLFLAGMTDLGLSVTVTNHSNCVPAGCPTKTYTNPPGKRLNIIDTEFF